jgi:glycosyltransferase involved in cell wall biosynthesis
MLMPGLVGLALLDAFASDTPLVTTAIGYHSPEIEYMDPGRNGELLSNCAAPEEYAEHVAMLLSDPKRLATLRQGCRQAAGKYTIEAMVDRFVRGVHQALAGMP